MSDALRHALVFGGTGQIGQPLLALLQADGWRITALSRQAHAGAPGVHWLRGDLSALPQLPTSVDAIFSCGPLDAFGRWYTGGAIEAGQVVAFGSTSIDTKSDSCDAGERELASRLRGGEAAVFAGAERRGVAATVLRPTLVYGAGRDATLTRIAQMARRWGRFALPRGANGLRQPVHVDDLAAAAFACLGHGAVRGNAYAVPGGEALTYRDMVARVLASLRPPPTLLELPAPLFSLALRAAAFGGRGAGPGEAAVQRMRRDLVFDAGPATRDFGYAPRAFQPTAAMFDAHA